MSFLYEKGSNTHSFYLTNVTIDIIKYNTVGYNSSETYTIYVNDMIFHFYKSDFIYGLYNKKCFYEIKQLLKYKKLKVFV
jgi:hypothetical protein